MEYSLGIILLSNLANELNILRAIGRERILGKVGVVEILPVDSSALVNAVLLHGLAEANHTLTSNLLLLDAVDHQLDLEHDGVILLAVKTDDVAASLKGVLGEDGRDGLEDGVADKVAIGGLSFPVTDELLVQLQSLLVQAEFVLKGNGEPDVAKNVSIDLTDVGWDLPVSSNKLKLNRHVAMSILA